MQSGKFLGHGMTARGHLSIEGKNLKSPDWSSKGSLLGSDDNMWLRAGQVPITVSTPMWRWAIFGGGLDFVNGVGCGRGLYFHNLGIIWALEGYAYYVVVIG